MAFEAAFEMAGASAALLVDLTCWWLARDWAGLVLAIAAAGAVYMASTVLMLFGILADLWQPER